MRYHKRLRAAAEGPARLAALPPRTPPTATQGALPPEIPLLIGLQRRDVANINASRGDRACGRESSAVIASPAVGFPFLQRIRTTAPHVRTQRIGFRYERGFAAGLADAIASASQI